MVKRNLLSERELDVLRGLLSGMTDREIAKDLRLSINTIKRHAQAIYWKLQIDGRPGLVPLRVEIGALAVPKKAMAAHSA